MSKARRPAAPTAAKPEVQAAMDAVARAEAVLQEARRAYQQAQAAQATASPEHACRNDLERLYDQFLELVKKYPGVGVAGAATLGFLIGRALRR